MEGAICVREFKTVKALGKGDMGTVYLARHMETSKAVAMKVINKVKDGRRRKRALTEARILKKLDHPFLPKLYTTIESSSHLYLCITYCSGGNLNILRHMQTDKRFSHHAARFYAAEVVLALEYLHENGIVYRDLKPENILVQNNGHIMLTDFDLALTVEEDGKHGKKTEKNVFVGTEEYVAPEVLWGEAHGFAMDWWGFGVFLYEMVYGRTPFKGKTRRDTFTNVLCLDLPLPHEGNVHLSDLLTRLLVKDPARRLGSHGDAMEIKSHPFFHGIHWDKLQFICRPPFLPPYMEFDTLHDILEFS